MIEEQIGAAEAENLLEGLGIDTLPIKLTDIVDAINCQSFKLQMEYQDFKSDVILGKAVGNSSGALIYINKNIPDLGRMNFTAAHELGHVCMHIMPKKKLLFECGKTELADLHNDPIERQANGFASGLLMPRHLITQSVGTDINWENINDVSKLCQTSLEASYRRLSFLGKEPTALVIHKNGKFCRFVSSLNFGFYIQSSHLSDDQKSLAVDVNEDPYPAEFDSVDAADWVNVRLKGDTLETLYSSTIILKEGYSYTLLTYDDECFADNAYS